MNIRAYLDIELVEIFDFDESEFDRDYNFQIISAAMDNSVLSSPYKDEYGTSTSYHWNVSKDESDTTHYNEEKHIIKKEDFAKAIRLFITLVLFLE